MTDLEQLAYICQQEISVADGQGDDLQANRNAAISYYFGAKRGDELPNRSATISMDVSDMINACLAMLVPMLTTDALLEFEPDGPQDEDAARIESQIVNRIIIEDNAGYVQIQSALKSALLLKNGVMRVRMDYSSGDSFTYNLDGETDERKRAALNNEQDGETRRLHGDMLTVVQESAAVKVCSVPTQNCIYQAGYTGPFQGLRFFGEFCWYTRSELLQMEVPRTIVEGLQAMGNGPQPDNTPNNMLTAAVTSDQDSVACCWCYVLTDLDGDGISERYEVLIANNQTGLIFEQVDMIPYAMGTPFINPNSITGESLFDHLWQTQNNKTVLTRQLLDNVAAINNGRYIYDPSQTDEKDILNPFAGSGIRSRNPSSVQVMNIPDVTSGILQALIYEDKVRAERGGAALEMMQPTAQMSAEGVADAARQFTTREALVSMMGTNIAETLIRGIYSLTHEFLRRYSNRTYTAILRGDVIEVDPRQWNKRTRMNVKPGLTPGQRGHIEAALGQHVQAQAAAMQNGLNNVIASVDTLYRTQIDYLRMAGIANPERLIIDPQTQGAQAALQASQQQAQAMQQMQQQLAQAQVQIEQMKVAQKAEADAATNKLGYYETDARVAIAEAQIVGDGTITLEKTRMDNTTQIITARERSAGGESASLIGKIQ